MEPATYIVRRILDNAKDRRRFFSYLTEDHLIGSKGHELLFGIIKELPYKRLSADIIYDVIYASDLKRQAKDKLLAIVGETESLGVVTRSEFEYYFEALTKYAKQQLILEGLKAANDKLVSDADGAVELASEYFSRSQRLSSNGNNTSSVRSVTALEPDIEASVFPTGFQRIDEVTGGAKLTELWIWGAYTSEFKSTALLSIAHTNMLKGKNSVFVSLEMSLKEIQRRLICLHSARVLNKWLEFRAIELKTYSTKKSRKRLAKAADDFDFNESYGDIFIHVPRPGVDLDTIMREYEVMNDKSESPILLIDYAQKLKPKRYRRESRLEFTELVDLAKQHAMNCRGGEGCVLYSAWQMSREGRKYAEDADRYRMSDLSESVGAEQAANVIVWSLYKDDYKRRKELKIGLAKSRNSSISGSMHFVAVGMEHGFISQVPVDGDTGEDIEEVDFD